jgi:hypothetical protein
MKFRNRFLKYGCAKQSDILTAGLYPSLNVCSIDPPAGTPPAVTPPPAGTPPEVTPPPAASGTVTITQAQLDSLIAKAGTATTPATPPVSAIDKIEADRKTASTEADKLDETRKTVSFDMAFNGFIDKNKNLFTIDTVKFRESAKGLQGEELERVLSATAAKDFFRKDENVQLLPERDRDYIKNSIMTLADNAIDYRKAWQLIEDAIHIKSRISENGQYRKNAADSNINNGDTPNVTAYLEKCAAAGKPKAA